MEIRLKLLGLLKEKTPDGGTLQLADGATIEDALRLLDLPEDRIQVFAVNGELERDRTRRLAESDELAIIPPVGGG